MTRPRPHAVTSRPPGRRGAPPTGSGRAGPSSRRASTSRWRSPGLRRRLSWLPLPLLLPLLLPLACLDESLACADGSCTQACDPPRMICADACVDPRLDPLHCGDCDAPCPADQPCVQGQCETTSLHHVLITGQSLSVGKQSALVHTTQPFDNVSFVTGVRAGGTGLDALVPLVETADGALGETVASSMANRLTAFARARGGDHRSLMSAHGVEGTPYHALRKGTEPYAEGMAQVRAGADLARAAGETHAVRAVVVIHGESDHVGSNERYDLDLLEWQRDYETDIQAITGQTRPVPMLTDQMSSFTAYGAETSIIPLLQLQASRARPDRILLVGPKYPLPYAPDGFHLTGDGEAWLGEMHAKVFEQVLVRGEPWRPLSPRTLTRDGAEITVRLWVPVPPLVLDEVRIRDPGDYGFEYTDRSGAPPQIVAVDLLGEDSVRITLSEVPVGPDPRVRYAMRGIPDQPAGPTTGARGNLRDSDPTTSRRGYPLYNWCVHFDEPIP